VRLAEEQRTVSTYLLASLPRQAPVFDWYPVVVRGCVRRLENARELKEGLMASRICRCAVIKVHDLNRWKPIAAETKGELASFAALRWQTRKRTFWLGCIKMEADNGSATKQEVDAYLRSLEYEFSQRREHTSERSGKEYRGKVASKGWLSNSFTFLWGLVAVAITAGCFWWLARVILKALS
jgi:hypothetical protein